MGFLAKLFSLKPNKLDCALVIAPVWGVLNPPIGLAYVKSMLVNSGYKSKCFDFNIVFYHISNDKIHWDLNYPGFFHDISKIKECQEKYSKLIRKWVNHVLSYNPKIVGFSIFQSNALFSIILAKEIKKRNKKITLFAGGIELDNKHLNPDKLKTYFENGFDYLLTRKNNEILDFFNCVFRNKSCKHIPGIAIEKDGKIVINKKEALKKNVLLDLIPNYSDFDINEYTDKWGLPVNFSYGCTNRCSFCIDPWIWDYFASKKGEKMYEELSHYRRLYPNIRHFYFTDSLINGNPKELENFCDLVIQNRLKFSWNAKARFDKSLTYSLLLKIKKTGCTNLDFGLESGSQKVLADMNKKIDLDEARRILRDCTEIGIRTLCFIIIGYPTETDEDFQKTLDFIRENRQYISEIGQTTCCYIVKPSTLYKNREKYGIEGGPSGWRNSIVTPEIRKARAEKLITLVKELYGKEHEVQLH